MLSATPCQPVLLHQRTLLGKYSDHITDLLSRNNYATFKEIKTKTITVQGSRGDSKKAKLFITLSRSENFFENMKKFNEIKDENEKFIDKEKAAREAAKAKEWFMNWSDTLWF